MGQGYKTQDSQYVKYLSDSIAQLSNLISTVGYNKNYLRSSGDYTTTSTILITPSTSNWSVTPYLNRIRVLCNVASSVFITIPLVGILVSGNDYIFSVKMKSSVGGKTVVPNIEYGGSTYTNTSFIVGTAYSIFTFSIPSTNGLNISNMRLVFPSANVGEYYDIEWMQFELGTQNTIWKPATEDVYSAIATLTSAVTGANNIATNAQYMTGNNVFVAGEDLTIYDVVLLDSVVGKWFKSTTARTYSKGVSMVGIANGTVTSGNAVTVKSIGNTRTVGVATVGNLDSGSVVYVRGIMLNEVFTTDGTITSGMIAGYSFLRIGTLITTNSIMFERTAPEIYTVNADGNISAVNGVTLSGSGGSSGGSSDTATNIAGGAAGYIPYQTAADTTSFIIPGTAGYTLTSNGTGPLWTPNTLMDFMPNENFKTAVTVATTADLNASLKGTNTLTGYGPSQTLACTTTAGSSNVTTTSTAGLMVGSVISVATTKLAANTTVSSITSATVFVVTNIAAIATTAITGTGSVATATFAAKTYAPFAVGASITITGAVPTTYNGTFTVTACTTTTVSWASTETTTATTQGSIAFTIAAGSSISTNFIQSISALSIDGVTLSVNDRVLVKNQTKVGGLTVTANRDNGIYVVTDPGTTSTPWILTRSSDCDTIVKLAGAMIPISKGTTSGGSMYKNKNKVTDVIGTTALVFYYLIDSAAITGSGNLVFATSPTLTTPTLSGNVTMSSGSILAGTSLAVVAAGTTQATATALTTADIVQVTSGTGGVKLPTGSTGRTITIINTLAVSIVVYPLASQYIDSLAINVGITLAAGCIMEFICVSATLWRTSTNFVNDWAKTLNKSTTISGYGITDANISGNVITLGANTMTPYTATNPQTDIAGTAAKATADGNGNVIASTYGNSLAASGSSTVLKAKDGTVLSTLTPPNVITLTSAAYNALVLAGTVDPNMVYMVTGVNNGATGAPQLVTTAQYNALTAAQKLNTLFYITDYNNGLTLAEIGNKITWMTLTHSAAAVTTVGEGYDVTAISGSSYILGASEVLVQFTVPRAGQIHIINPNTGGTIYKHSNYTFGANMVQIYVAVNFDSGTIIFGCPTNTWGIATVPVAINANTIRYKR